MPKAASDGGSSAGGSLAGGSLFSPLRHRGFRLLWVGMSISLLGDGVYLVALAWQAYALSPKPQALAILGICVTVPQLLALLGGGVLSDRAERRRILLVSDVVRFAAVAVVAALVLGGQARMWHLVVVSVVYGLGAGIAAPLNHRAQEGRHGNAALRVDRVQSTALKQML